MDSRSGNPEASMSTKVWKTRTENQLTNTSRRQSAEYAACEAWIDSQILFLAVPEVLAVPWGQADHLHGLPVYTSLII